MVLQFPSLIVSIIYFFKQKRVFCSKIFKILKKNCIFAIPS